MRVAVFVVTAVQVLIVVGFAISLSGVSDAGQSLVAGQVTLIGIIMAVLMVPALILAIVGRGVGMALTLSLIALLVLIIGLGQF